jgi:putative inorganic carbon (HCO3(-)) transporter
MVPESGCLPIKLDTSVRRPGPIIDPCGVDPGHRAAALTIGVGFAAAAVAFLPSRERSLDSYLDVKELIIHASAGLAALLAVRTRRFDLRLVDAGLLSFALVGVTSLLLDVRNPWWACRAICLSLSGATLFLLARNAAAEGHHEPLLVGCAVGVTLLATAIAGESLGLIPTISMPGRAPGGPAGNRNFAAHLLVLGMPPLLCLLDGIPTRRRHAWVYVGLALCGYGVAISRCRTAWLGGLFTGALAASFAYFGPWANRLRRAGIWCLVLGAIIAPLAPTTVEWASASPYRATASHLFDSRTGSGRGRVIQYLTTLKIFVDHPVLGVGPGNWSSAYPLYASLPDPSYDVRATRAVNRLPNSDWLGLLAERGIVGIVLLLGPMAVIGWRALRHLRSSRSGRKASTLVLLSLAAWLIMGSTDAVLLRPEPLALLAITLGAGVGQAETRPDAFDRSSSGGLVQRILLLLAACGAAVGLASSGARVVSISLRDRPDQVSLLRSIQLDPGDYSLVRRAARRAAIAADCRSAVALESRALRLFPDVAGSSLLRGTPCEPR